MQDPVSLCPSALVKRYNISQQKELELQLAVQQDILQRCAATAIYAVLLSALRKPNHLVCHHIAFCPDRSA